MQWKEYRFLRTRVATGEADGARRVVELLDGRHLVEREGAPAQIVEGTYESALAASLAMTRSTAPRVSFWRRLWRALFGGAS